MVKLSPVVAVIASCFVLVGLLSGCSVGPDVQRPSPLVSSSVSSSLVPVVLPSAGTVVASGRLVGRASGYVSVSSLGSGDYSVRFTGLGAPSARDLRVHLGANRRVFNCAGVSGTNLDLGALRTGQTQQFQVRHGYAPNADQDPSFLHSVALTSTTDQFDGEDCADRTYATAQLTWHLPVTRPDLLVKDRGASHGAQGSVVVQDGRPVSYLVADGDTKRAIGQRFNITVSDIFYLNPQRGIGEDPEGKRGETLNLSRATR